jgi:short-subunit dehydrogenase
MTMTGIEDLGGRTAVVTGASLGIGEGIAKTLAREGCHVALVARGRQPLEQVADEIRASGGTAHVHACDMRDPAAIADMIAGVEAALGPIDVLVNNVGAGTFKPIHHMTIDEALQAVDLPLTAAIAATHAVVPGMIARRQGHIVNLTSPAGYFPLPYMVPYTASRHAMLGLSLSLREELEPHGIGVSLICPAQVDTGYFQRNDADIGWYPKLSAVFPVLQPNDVGEQVLRAIRQNRAETIFPTRLAAIVRAYQRAPQTSLRLLKALGLFQPRGNTHQRESAERTKRPAPRSQPTHQEPTP